jgi:hypothetical protein
MNRGVSLQDGGFERMAPSELERKPRFKKKAFYENQFALFIFAWNFNKSLI